MDKAALEKYLEQLKALIPVCEAAGFDDIQRYAKTQFVACKDALYEESEPDPTTYKGNCQFIRGQGEVWRGLMDMRNSVAQEIANVRRQIAAKGREA